MKLIILTAGKGTRFLPLTNTIPKGMVPILDKPLLCHTAEPYLQYVDDIIFVISSPLGEKIKNYFKDNYRGHNIFYVIQKEQKGTMNALLQCKDLIKDEENFCVCNGDDLFKKEDIENAIKKNIIGIGISKKIMPKNYLGINTENEFVSGFRRHETGGDFVEDIYYNGFNILNNKIFQFEPKQTKDGELGLPHTLFANLENYPLKTFVFNEWETVNGPGDIERAEKFIRN